MNHLSLICQNVKIIKPVIPKSCVKPANQIRDCQIKKALASFVISTHQMVSKWSEAKTKWFTTGGCIYMMIFEHTHRFYNIIVG